MKDRILMIRKENRLTQDAFAEKIGLSKNYVWQMEKGERTPSERTIKDICREFNISYLWLTKGIEPMYEQADTSSMARIDAIMTGENEFAKNLFREFSKLDKSEWELLEKIIKNLSKEL